MTLEQYLIFLTITLAWMFAPGPATLLAVNNGIRYGSRMAILATFGNILAFQVLVLLSIIGLGAVLAASTIAFQVLKIIGALYLVYLGFKLWTTPIATFKKGDNFEQQDASQRVLFRRAFFITLSNPKALIYISALLPQFINVNNFEIMHLLTISLTIALSQFIAFTSYAMLASSIQVWLKNENNCRWFNRFSGSTFIGFGVALGLSNR